MCDNQVRVADLFIILCLHCSFVIEHSNSSPGVILIYLIVFFKLLPCLEYQNLFICLQSLTVSYRQIDHMNGIQLFLPLYNYSRRVGLSAFHHRNYSWSHFERTLFSLRVLTVLSINLINNKLLLQLLTSRREKKALQVMKR